MLSTIFVPEKGPPGLEDTRRLAAWLGKTRGSEVVSHGLTGYDRYSVGHELGRLAI